MKDIKEIRADIIEIKQILKSNPIFTAQVIYEAQAWVDNNLAAKILQKKNPQVYEKYFEAVMYERAAVLLQKKRYI